VRATSYELVQVFHLPIPAEVLLGQGKYRLHRHYILLTAAGLVARTPLNTAPGKQKPWKGRWIKHGQNMQSSII
jgi:hypothetical protein